MVLPFGTSHYNKRVKNPDKPYTSTHTIRIVADDANWFRKQMRPGEKSQTTFHRLLNELARLTIENEKLKSENERLKNDGY